MGSGRGGVEKSLKKLEEQGLVSSANSDEWALTKAGIEQARNLMAVRGR